MHGILLPNRSSGITLWGSRSSTHWSIPMILHPNQIYHLEGPLSSGSVVTCLLLLLLVLHVVSGVRLQIQHCSWPTTL